MVFRNIEELIHHFRATSDLLCCKLTDVCPRTRRGFPVTEIDRSSLILLERLCSSDMDDMWYGTWENGDKKVPVHIRRLSPQLHSKSDVLQETKHYFTITVRSLHCKSSDVCYHKERKLALLTESVSLSEKKIYLAAQVACGIDYLGLPRITSTLSCVSIATSVTGTCF